MEHTYLSQTFQNIQTEENEIEIVPSAGDSLLIDMVKSYPHLYDKSSPNFKDAIMKENSWVEIGKIMMCSRK